VAIPKRGLMAIGRAGLRGMSPRARRREIGAGPCHHPDRLALEIDAQLLRLIRHWHCHRVA